MNRDLGVDVVTTGESGASARAQLAILRDVLRRQGLPMAERLDVVLQGSEGEAREFLVSGELWGRTGSIVYRAGLAGSWEARLECERAFSALGEWQVAHGYADSDVMHWVAFFRQRREHSQPLGAGRMLGGDAPPGGSGRGGRVGRVAAPWSVRDVWLGVLAAVVLVGAGWGVAYLAAASSLRLDLDLWVALFPTLIQLLFLVPVWWFAVRKTDQPLKALGFVSFRFRVLAVGFGLLFGYFMLSGLYAALLQYFGLQVQTDLTPLVQRLSNPWPLFVTVVVVAPVVEEVFFRGFVFGGLRARYDWRWAAAISAALFAVAHVELTFFIPAFAMGYLFAYLYQRSDSVWPAIILHMAINALAMTVLYVRL